MIYVLPAFGFVRCRRDASATLRARRRLTIYILPVAYVTGGFGPIRRNLPDGPSTIQDLAEFCLRKSRQGRQRYEPPVVWRLPNKNMEQIGWSLRIYGWESWGLCL